MDYKEARSAHKKLVKEIKIMIESKSCKHYFIPDR